MSYITCNFKSRFSIYPFFLPFLFIANRYFRDKIFQYYDCEDDKYPFKLIKYNLPYLFYLYLPKLFSGIIILIVNKNIKGENKSDENLITRNYHLTAKSSNKKKFFLLIFIISIFVVIGDIGDNLLYYYQKVYLNDESLRMGWLVEKKSIYIIFVPIFCYLVLKIEFHRHHVLALALGSIGAFIVNLSRFITDFSKLKDWKYHIINTIISSFFSFSIVLTKYIMSKFLIISPYTFLFYEGIFNILNSLLCTLLVYPLVIKLPDYNINIDKDKENKNYFINNYIDIFTFLLRKDRNFYIFFSLSFCFSFIYYILNVLTIYNYSPFLFILLESFLPIDEDVLLIVFDKSKDFIIDNVIKRNIYQLFGYFLLFFASLILNEIIILNFYGFNKNTFERITFRGKLDSCIMENDTNDGSDLNNQTLDEDIN